MVPSELFNSVKGKAAKAAIKAGGLSDRTAARDAGSAKHKQEFSELGAGHNREAGAKARERFAVGFV
jgi:hypothetical protein